MLIYYSTPKEEVESAERTMLNSIATLDLLMNQCLDEMLLVKVAELLSNFRKAIDLTVEWSWVEGAKDTLQKIHDQTKHLAIRSMLRDGIARCSKSST